MKDKLVQWEMGQNQDIETNISQSKIYECEVSIERM